MLDANPMASAARMPRGLVKINDVVVPGWIDWEVSNNTFAEADTFRVRYALQAMSPVLDMGALATVAQLKVEIFAGFPNDPARPQEPELVQQIEGVVDDLHFDPVQNTVEMSGRDYTSRFIDSKVTGQWRNKTASQVAEALAVKHRLSSAVVPTKTLVGQYFDADHGRMSNAMTEWDLLNWLASESLDATGRRFVVYVKNRTLHFEPEPSPEGEVYHVEWLPAGRGRAYARSNVSSLSFSRNLTVLRDIVVVVSSWHRKQKKVFTATYPRKNGAHISPGGATVKQQVYTRKYTDLTQDQVNLRAQALHQQLSAHEVKLEARLPCDELMQTTRLIKVSGTGTDFDQFYYPDSITRSFSLSEGYVMTVSAKNHSTESDGSLR